MEETIFEPQGLGLTIFQDRYARDHGEGWKEGSRRVADHVAQAEENGNVKKYAARFYEQIVSNKFNPGGRIWYGAGRPKAQLLNCVSGDTKVQTVNGLVDARDLAGSTVQTLTQDGTYREAEWSNFGSQMLFKVIFSNGDEIRATANHEWIVSKPKGGYERTTTSELLGRCVPLQHAVDFEYDEPQYLLGIRHGLVYGDGTIDHTGKSSMCQFGDSSHLIPDYFDKHSIQYHARYPEGVTYVGALPSEWKSTPEEGHSSSYLRGFIAGLIAADGCVDSRGHTMIHAADLNELITIRRLAASVGLPTTSLEMTREFNPWTGDLAPVWKLSFVKAGVYDEKMIIKNSHRDKMFASPEPKKQATAKVIAVISDKVESVYCCEEPVTNTWVAGPGYVTSNCFVVPATDSREGWGKTTSDVIVISGLMGGVGINMSPIRPRGYQVKGTGGVSTGAVSLMELINGVGNVICGGGGRRMALMLCLDINHPDLEEFLSVKLDLAQLNNANISVMIPEDFSTERFVEMVKNAEDIELLFNGIPSGKTINAKQLWDRLVENAWTSGEPGILNGYLANKMNNLHYFKPLISTNPCGEIFLEEYGCCCLGALVLPRFVEDGQFNWDSFDESVRLGVRFLDNVLTVNHYPLPEVKENCENVRRLGLGVMGLHTMLLDLGMKYDSEEAFAFVDRLFNTLKNTAYDASVNLAIEKGPFAAYDPRFLESGFAKTLKRGIRNKIREHGIRNCALLTIAPTGTTSMMTKGIWRGEEVGAVSSGIEPHNPAVYWRNYFKPSTDGRRELTRELVVEDVYYKYPDLIQSAVDVPVESHFKMQQIVQRHIDNAVSKTINLHKDFPKDQFGDVWLEYLPYLKGTTIYRYGSRENEPINPVPREDWDRLIAENVQTLSVEMTIEERMELECPSGVCEIPQPAKLLEEVEV